MNEYESPLGIGKFVDFFKDYSNNYIIVGGTATSLFLKNASLDSRKTKDIDMVIVSEKLDVSFINALWSFITNGGYEAYVSKDSAHHYYRFVDPKSNGYPFMIELFSRKQDLHNLMPSIFTPLSVDGAVASLSAIILDDAYYSYLLKGKTVIGGLSVLDPVHLIGLKAKAHVDFMEKKKRGMFVNEDDSRKHKNDVFRLLQLLNENEKDDAPVIVKNDIRSFIQSVDKDSVDVGKLTNGALDFDEAIGLLRKVYKL